MNRFITFTISVIMAVAAMAQSADERIGSLMGDGRWFELERAMRDTVLCNDLNPVVRGMGQSLVAHYFNRPEQACSTLSDLLNNHQQELGDNTLSMASLLGINLYRAGHYAEAANLLQSLADQLAAQGVDSTTVAGYTIIAGQCRSFADIGDVCHPLHPSGEYHLPLVADNRMHAVSGDTVAHFICVEAEINGTSDLFIFDTGAGMNVVTSEMAKKFGLRPLDTKAVAQGFGIVHGEYAIADTLRIGNMAWKNVPFVVMDDSTGHPEADKALSKMRPVLGLPVMLTMGEMQLDFERNELIIPASPSSIQLDSSNMMRTDTENLTIAAADEDGEPLLMHFDTGGYYTIMSPQWYRSHKAKVETCGTPDTLRMAGAGGVSITRSYRIPGKGINIGGQTARLDSLTINTGISIDNKSTNETPLLSATDGTIGLDCLERFSKVVINFREMYIEGINPKENNL